jgi:glycosyltransferase involved in cell wall biosynthesis
LNRTRILFFQHAAAPSGAAVSLALLLQCLDAGRYQPIVACTRPTAAIRDYYARQGIEVLPVEGIHEFPHTTGGWFHLWKPTDALRLATTAVGMPRSIAAASETIRRIRPDIVHVNSVVLAPVAMAARRLGVPFVWHIRETVVRGHLGLRRRWLSRLVRELPDAAIFLSSSDMRRLGPGQSTWSIVPNATRIDGVNAPGRTAARRRLGIADDLPVVLFLGGYSRLKGGEVLLAALPSVAREVPGVRCLLAGAHEPSSGVAPRLGRALLPLLGMKTPRQRFEAALARVAESVWVLAWQDDTEPLYAAADVLVFPALEPHFPRPVVEAFARRLPVIVSDLAGYAELVTSEVTGLLVPPGDAEALATALVSLLKDRSRARRMAESAHAVARERFDLSAQAAEIVSVYDRVLGGRRLGVAR